LKTGDRPRFSDFLKPDAAENAVSHRMKSASLQSRKERAGVLIRQGKLDAAKTLLEEIVQSDPLDVDSWYTLAAVSHRLGTRGEAARCYEKTIALNPNHPEAHYYLGNIRGQSEDYEGAIRCYR